jgi:hypothetical protein
VRVGGLEPPFFMKKTLDIRYGHAMMVTHRERDMDMIVTQLRVSSRTGNNGRPSSGDVWFSDGKSYGWLVVPAYGEQPEHYSFSSYRSSHGGVGSTLFSFRSKAREAALVAALNA